MTSTASSTNPSQRSLRTSGLLVLVPPRHSKLPLTFLTPGKHLVGTHEACSIRMEADGVQPRHAMILVGEQKTFLKALDPRTWVNDSVVTESALRSGDTISFGPITYRVRVATADETQNLAQATTDAPSIGVESTEFAPLAQPVLSANPEPVSIKPDPTSAAPKSEPTSETMALSIVPIEAPAIDETPQLVSSAPFSVDVSAAPMVIIAPTEIAVEEPLLGRNSTEPEETRPALVDEFQTRLNPPREVPPTDAAEVRELIQESVTITDPFEDVRAQVQFDLQRLAARDDELKQRAAELALQSQQLAERTQQFDERSHQLGERTDELGERTHQLNVRIQQLDERTSQLDVRTLQLDARTQELDERISHVAEREADLERGRARLAAESEQQAANDLKMRRELEDEYARQSKLWQEWEATYRRSTEELKTQLQTLEQRRTELQRESERMSGERTELQGLRSDHKRERDAYTIERDRVDRDLEEFRAGSAAFETERREQLQTLQELRDQLANERRSLVQAQSEFLAVRQQFEQERSLLSADRSKDSLRREQEIREHSLVRDQWNAEQAAVQKIRFDLESKQRTVDDQRTELNRQREEFDLARAEFESLRNSWNQSRDEVHPDHPSIPKPLAQDRRFDDDFSRQREDFDGPRRTFEDRQISSEPAPFTSAPAEFPSNYWHSPVGFPPPMASADRTLPDFRDPPSGGQFDQSLPAKPHTPSASLSVRATVGRSELGAPLDHVNIAPPLERGLPPRSALLAVQQDFAPSLSRTEPTESPSVDRTLTDVSERFGYLSRPPELDLAPVTSIESTFDVAAVETNRHVEQPMAHEPAGHDAAMRNMGESNASRPEESIFSLRAQLAEMFHLPEQTQSTAELATETNLVEESRRRVDREVRDINPNSPDVGTANLTDEDSVEFSLSQSRGVDSRSAVSPSSIQQQSPAPIEVTEVVADSKNADEDDEWTRRLRELSQVATDTNSQSVPAPSPTNQEPEAAESEEEDEEYSVEAQLARLLGRPKVSNAQPGETAKSTTANSDSQAKTGRDPSESASASDGAGDDDRSHLTAGPTHRQNKNAVREAVQSFREVAQMSARTALARHSWNILRGEIFFKAGLTVVSAVATVWYVTSYMTGTDPALWKSLTCGITTFACGHRLFNTSFQITQWRSKNSPQAKTPKTPAPPAE